MKLSNIKNFVRSEEFVILLLILGMTIGAWLGTDEWNRRVSITVLGLGILFDVMSLAIRIRSKLVKKQSSGFPVIGLLFYVWFLLVSKFSLVGWTQTEPVYILLFKIADGALLFGFHTLCNGRMRFRRPVNES